MILWDVTRKLCANQSFEMHNGPIRAMAFSPDGNRLVTAGADGLVVHWNVAQGQPVESLAARISHNTLAYSPDGRFIVVGSENGAMIRLDAANFRGGNSARLRVADRRPVEIVAFNPDGSRLAASIVSDTDRVPNPMAIGCDIELRAMPEGNIVRQWPRVHGLVRAMAFSPDGKRLAYAGGAAQGILVQDTAALETSPVELKGKGTSPFDLGFTKDSQVVGFTRDPVARPMFQGFITGLIWAAAGRDRSLATSSPAQSSSMRATR